jgi:tungstate transport system substrate-binding protein
MLPGCGKEAERRELILATTTSVQDTGLLDEWIPMFESEYPYSVKVIAVGSGQAIEMARKGECDVLLAHSPSDEERLVSDGFGINRKLVMHNDFVIVGPPDDPAKIRGIAEAPDAFKKIAESGSTFISRGDQSGTHKKEQGIWIAAGINPSGSWYIQSGKGMGDTLLMAREKRAYTLTDRATYLFLKDSLDLQILSEGHELYLNRYSVIEVNPAVYPDVNAEGARAFSEFVTGERAQDFLRSYGMEELGEPMFYPDAIP